VNKHFSLLLHSMLIVGTLLPLSPLTASVQTRVQSNSSGHQFVDQPNTPTQLDHSADNPQFLAYGQGVPQYRGGGGTR
jgi:hypothetical protein